MRLNLLRGVLAACLAATCLADAPAQDVDDSPPAPPQSAQASDHPLDGGEQIDVTWELSPDDPTPRIRDMLREAGVFEIESLPEDDEAEAQALLEPFAGYWLYRTLTDKPMEVRAWEDALEEIVKTLTDPEEPMAVKRSTLSALLETLRSAPAAETPYDELPNLGEAAAAEIESILEGGADADTDAMTRIASLVESDVFGAIPSSEVEEEYAAEKKTAIKTAKKQVTEQILDEHDLELDEFHDASDEVKAQIREARAAAAEAAAEDVEARARANAGEVHWKLVVDLPPGDAKRTIDKLDPKRRYRFKVHAIDSAGNLSGPAVTAEAISPDREWFDGGRFWLLVITVILCASVVYWIWHARSGRDVKVRKIAGLEAVDEAVGRATEMGRSCLFVPGIQDMNDIQTIAAITILARVARTAAEYDAKVEVPTARSLVMTTARETVQNAFLSVGRPDAYNPDFIYYVTDEQFGYVAYLSGMMVREKPAACFYMGSFFAESLILAETGNAIGAIQVAGTAQPAQLPFFVAACDYTLIGEEFFAASAYLSGSAEELGSLKGQDVGKVVVAIGMIIGIFFGTFAMLTGSAGLYNVFLFIRETLLT